MAVVQQRGAPRQMAEASPGVRLPVPFGDTEDSTMRGADQAKRAELLAPLDPPRSVAHR